MFGGKLGITELLVILVIVLIFFGGRRIPEVMRGMGEGIRSFKDGMSGTDKPAGDKPAGDKPAEEKK
jgi:sec-independent protein translocase protein TatA